MIIEILPHENRTTTGAVKYQLRKNREHEPVLLQEGANALVAYQQKEHSKLLGIFNSIDDVDCLIDVMEEINALGNTTDPLFHVSISLPPGEVISDELFLEIAHEYLNDMGYGEQPYGVWLHTDRDHLHAHLVTTRVDRKTFRRIFDGKEKLRSSALAEKYEIKYGLQRTNHSKGRNYAEESRGVRYELDRRIGQVMRSRPQNMKILSEQLREQGVVLKPGREGAVYFSLLDEEGKEGKLYPSSKLKAFSKNNVHERLNINRNVRRYHRKRLKSEILPFLEEHTRITPRELRDFLQRKKIYIKFERNSGGIYGVSFISGGVTFKGSEIDPVLSWGHLQTKLVAEAVTTSRKTRQPSKNNMQHKSLPVQHLDRILEDMFGYGVHGRRLDGEREEDDEEQ